MKRERSGISLLLGLLLAFSMLVSITQDSKQPTRSWCTTPQTLLTQSTMTILKMQA